MRKLGVILGLLVLGLTFTSCEKEELLVDDYVVTSDGDTTKLGDTVSSGYVDANGEDISWVFGEGVNLHANQHGRLYFDPFSDSCYFEAKKAVFDQTIADATYEYIGDAKIVIEYYQITGVGSATPKFQSDTVVVGFADQTEGIVRLRWKDFNGVNYGEPKSYNYIVQD